MKAEINVEFNETSDRQEIQSGEEIKTLFGKLKKWLSDLKPIAFSGSYNDLSDTPSSLPADGGEAEKAVCDSTGADIAESFANVRSNIAVNKSTLGYQRKNLFNETGYLSSITSVYHGTSSISGNQISLTATGSDCYTKPYASGDGGYRIPVDPDTEYILSWESDNNNNGYVYVFMNGSTSNSKLAGNSGSKRLKFTTNSNTTFITIRLGVSNSGDSITYSNIMLRYADITDDIYEEYKPSLKEKLESLIVDSAMSDTSVNPVQNKVIKAYIDQKIAEISGS